MEFIVDNANYFDNDEEMLSFVVQELTNVSHQINDFSPRCTVYMLKALLECMTTDNLGEDQIHLSCNGIVIKDDRVISSYGIINGNVMHIVPLLCGGARTRITEYVDLIPYLMTNTSSNEDSDEDFD